MLAERASAALISLPPPCPAFGVRDAVQDVRLGGSYGPPPCPLSNLASAAAGSNEAGLVVWLSPAAWSCYSCSGDGSELAAGARLPLARPGRERGHTAKESRPPRHPTIAGGAYNDQFVCPAAAPPSSDKDTHNGNNPETPLQQRPT